MHLYLHNATLVAVKYYIYRKWKMQAPKTELRLFVENVADILSFKLWNSNILIRNKLQNLKGSSNPVLKKIRFRRSFTWEEIRKLLIF